MNKAITLQMTYKEWLMLFLLAFLWGGSFYLVEIALIELSPLLIVNLRVLLAAMALWIICLTLRLKIPTSANIWLAFLIMGLLNNAIPFLLITWGQIQITGGLASILNATTPIFTMMVASIFLNDENITKAKILGIFVGFVGVIILIGPSLLQHLGTEFLAQIAVLLAAISYGFAATYGRRFTQTVKTPLMVATGQLTMSSLAMLPFTLYYSPPWHIESLSLPTLLAIIVIAIFSTAMAYILYFRILAKAGATNLSLVTFLVPVSAIFLGITLLGEQLTWLDLSGLFFISLSLLVIDGRLFKKLN